MTDVLPGRITRAAIHCEAGELKVRLAQGGSWQLHLRRAADREWRLACGGDLEAGTPTPQAPPPDHPISLGSLRIDPASRRAWFDGVEVIFGRLEFALLSRLASDPSRVFTKDQLLRDIWGCEVDMSVRWVDSQASRVRVKLRKAGARNLIVNVWGGSATGSGIPSISMHSTALTRLPPFSATHLSQRIAEFRPPNHMPGVPVGISTHSPVRKGTHHRGIDSSRSSVRWVRPHSRGPNTVRERAHQ